MYGRQDDARAEVNTSEKAVREREFRELAEARQTQLRRGASLLCGDWRTILTRTFIDQQRKGGWREEPVSEPPHTSAAGRTGPSNRRHTRYGWLPGR